VTNHDNRTVKVSRAVNPTLAELVDTLAHELRHIEQPELDCGGRDVIGRGAPR